MCDVVIKEDNKRFNFRVAILPYTENKILVQKAEKDDFYSIIGGRVKLGERTADAICREVKEELDLNIKEADIKLFRVCENFFNYNNKDFHEILFVYVCNFSFVENFDDLSIKDKIDVKALWIDVDDLKHLNLKPEFIKHANLHDQLKHVVIG